mmetsp:Transcript_14997/g.49182  ORF Transcript_14997/g.49182 Transcript_14997/m.49182 type:complete len:214 (-) Transcript_14997:95-736(-)
MRPIFDGARLQGAHESFRGLRERRRHRQRRRLHPTRDAQTPQVRASLRQRKCHRNGRPARDNRMCRPRHRRPSVKRNQRVAVALDRCDARGIDGLDQAHQPAVTNVASVVCLRRVALKPPRTPRPQLLAPSSSRLMPQPPLLERTLPPVNRRPGHLSCLHGRAEAPARRLEREKRLAAPCGSRRIIGPPPLVALLSARRTGAQDHQLVSDALL